MPKKQGTKQKKVSNTTSSLQASPTKQSAVPIKYKFYCPYCWCFFRKLATLEKHLEKNHPFWYEKIAERKWGTLYRQFVVAYGVAGPWKKYWLQEALQERAFFLQSLKMPIKSKNRASKQKFIKKNKRPVVKNKHDQCKKKKKNQNKSDFNVAKSPSKVDSGEKQNVRQNNGDIIVISQESNIKTQNRIDEPKNI